jgi:hypothetical protein
VAGGLADYLSSGSHRAMPMVVAGSLLALTGMVLFLGLVLADTLRRRAGSFEMTARSG